MRTGLSVHSATVHKGLHEAGIRRERAKVVPAEKGESAPRRYGYEQAHRRHLPEQDHPSSLTDAEWRLVSDLFESEQGRGVPARYRPRLFADACCYVVRTGARMLVRRLTTTWFCKHPHRSGEQHTVRI